MSLRSGETGLLKKISTLQELCPGRFFVDLHHLDRRAPQNLTQSPEIDFSHPWSPMIVGFLGIVDMNASEHRAIGLEKGARLQEAELFQSVGVAQVVPVTDSPA